MASKLDKSLDEISSEKKSGGGGRGGRRGGRGGSGRSNGNGRGPRAEYSNPLSRDNEDDGESSGPVRRQRRQQRDTPGYGGGRAARADGDWGHDRFDDVPSSAPRSNGAAVTSPTGPRLETSTKVLVSNLDPSVAADDIKEIFQSLGNIAKAVIHYDQNSRSLGTAEVTFSNLATATRAVEEYDGAEVDGRPMTLKLLAGVAPPPRNVVTKRRERVTAPSGGPRRQSDSFYGGAREDRRDRQDRGDRAPRGERRTSRPLRGGSRGGARTGGGGRGGARNGAPRQKRESQSAPTEESLNSEMDAYQQARGGAPPAAAGQPSTPAATASE